jgi:hypothetical protein
LSHKLLILGRKDTFRPGKKEVNEYMPWGDCTGPWWIGSRENRSGYYNPWCRRAFGRGAGYGRGAVRYTGEPFRQPTLEEEKSYLEAVARDLENELKSVRDQIERLQSRS